MAQGECPGGDRGGCRVVRRQYPPNRRLAARSVAFSIIDRDSRGGGLASYGPNLDEPAPGRGNLCGQNLQRRQARRLPWTIAKFDCSQWQDAQTLVSPSPSVICARTKCRVSNERRVTPNPAVSRDAPVHGFTWRVGYLSLGVCFLKTTTPGQSYCE